MNTIWSDFVQSTEELYLSRGLRFRDDNKDTWLPVFSSLKNESRVLEVGCAGGLLLHMIKRFHPSVKATGLDRDDAHIAYAKRKTCALGLDAEFVVGDALSLPFADETYDLCYSHTVIEFMDAVAFLKEQYRVLASGGTAVVLSARTGLSVAPEGWKPVSGEEKDLLDKAWGAVEESGADRDHFTVTPMGESDYPIAFEKAGFSGIDIQFIALTGYAPDSATVPEELALRQIYSDRLGTLESMRKAHRMCPDSLTDEEWNRLERLINERYDQRVDRYNRGEKVWDIGMSNVLVVRGKKR